MIRGFRRRPPKSAADFAADEGNDQHACIPCAKAIGHHSYSAHRVSVVRSAAMTCSLRYAAIAHGPDSAFTGRPIMEVMKLAGRLGAAPCSRRVPAVSTNTMLQ